MKFPLLVEDKYLVVVFDRPKVRHKTNLSTTYMKDENATHTRLGKECTMLCMRQFL